MVYVKLLQDVAEGNVSLEQAREANAKVGLKTARVRGNVIAYVAGAIIPMHEAAATKYVERGLGEVVTL